MNKTVLDNIFKSYDIRGKVGSELNKETLTALGKALAEWLPSDGIVAVGRDMRPDSKSLSDAIIDGLITQGRDVWDIDEVTSDMIYFAVGYNGLAGGAMITASHNPGDDNGIKLCREQAKPIGEESGLFEIRDLVLANKFENSKSKGKISEKEISKDWIEHALSFIDKSELRPLIIAVDAGNGMAGKIFPLLEPHVPFQVNEMYFELDGTFPNHIANPLIPENLVDLQQTVIEKTCDVGIAFDGDGDRAVLVDEKGEALTGTVMTALLAQYFLGKEPNSTILYNAICGRSAVDAIVSNGGKAVRTRVGHSNIKADMRKHNALFAGEHSGHYYFKDNFNADSGLIAAVIALFILSQSNQSLSTLVAPFRKAYMQIPETNFKVSDKKSVMNNIAEVYSDGKIDWLDGLTVNFDSSWFNVRPSNTEPLLRMNAEAKTKTELDKLVLKVTGLINS